MDVLKNENRVEDWNQFINEGDLNALSRIYFQYYDLLFSYGLKITSDSQIVEDSIQNIFLSCIKSRKNITVVRSLNGYLLSSFRRELFNNLERKRRILYIADITAEQFDFYKNREQSHIDKRELEKLHQIIKQCISNLPSKQQEILYLRFESEISYDEIAQMMEISIDSCYKSVYRIIKSIREEATKMIKDSDDLIFFLICCLPRKN
jgi:RNA polymerase sigma factor (sigma-70 family)